MVKLSTSERKRATNRAYYLANRDQLLASNEARRLANFNAVSAQRKARYDRRRQQALQERNERHRAFLAKFEPVEGVSLVNLCRYSEPVGVTRLNSKDQGLVARFRWTLSGDGYAISSVHEDGQKRTVAMHRLVLGLKHGDPRQGDHINGDRLDNRRSNLRIVGQREQAQNMRPHRDGSSRYRGVSFHKECGLWVAYSQIKGVKRYLGSFKSESEAAAIAAVARRWFMPRSLEATRR